MLNHIPVTINIHNKDYQFLAPQLTLSQRLTHYFVVEALTIIYSTISI